MTGYCTTNPAEDLAAEMRFRQGARDGETKHDPANGQFTSGGGSSGGFKDGKSPKEQAKEANNEHFEKHGTLPAKEMSEGARKSNAKAMSSNASRNAERAKSAKNDKAKALYEKASSKLAEAAQHYSNGDHEAGTRAEHEGFTAEHSADLNNG